MLWVRETIIFFLLLLFYSCLDPPSILDILELTFVWAYFEQPLGNFFICPKFKKYPIFRQKVPQNFWNMLNPPPSPHLISKIRSKKGKQKYLKTFGFQCNPPFWTMSKTLLDNVQNKDSFCMASLRRKEKIVKTKGKWRGKMNPSKG